MANETNESNFMRNKVESFKSKMLKNLQKLGPPCFYMSLLFFYFSFFTIVIILLNQTYFSPLLFPDYVRKIPFITEFKDFHDFYDQNYKVAKGHMVILIEFGIFMELYFLLIFSYYRTCTTPPGEIPDDEVKFNFEQIWNINIPKNVSQNIKTEMFALALNKREEELLQNRNILNIQSLNDSTNSTSKMTFNQDISISSIESNPIVVNERTSTGGVRYCTTCTKFKVKFIF